MVAKFPSYIDPGIVLTETFQAPRALTADDILLQAGDLCTIDSKTGAYIYAGYLPSPAGWAIMIGPDVSYINELRSIRIIKRYSEI